MVIIKPTKSCNADCSYCCAPSDGAPKWTDEDFRRAFDMLEQRLHPAATFLWHGGEPMLLGPRFYRKAYDYARNRLSGVRFSMQSNMLSYSDRWKAVFREVFKGGISTSWDPDGQCRSIKGSPELYSRVFQAKMESLLNDGWHPNVIATFTDSTIHLARDTYGKALESSKNGRPYDIRLNYRYPAGRALNAGPAIRPDTYGRYLTEIYDRWIVDCPDFLVTPLDQMLMKVAGAETGRCPWSKSCTGRIIEIEPNFDVYNCGEFADVGNAEFRFGNLLKDGIGACLSSRAANGLAQRRYRHPKECMQCIHFDECEGGCMRDSVLFGGGLYGKFHYCESWKEIFSRIKESILTGEADRTLERLGLNSKCVVHTVRSKLSKGINSGLKNMRREIETSGFAPGRDNAMSAMAV